MFTKLPTIKEKHDNCLPRGVVIKLTKL